MQNFLDIDQIEASELRAILDQASHTKKARAGLTRGALDFEEVLKGHMVALIFEKPSTRTRISFAVGVQQMGGKSMIISGNEMHLGHGEAIADTARVLSRYVDLIMIRTFEESTLLEMAEHASVPVINGLTNRTHPCQIMADIMTYEEHRGSISGKRVVWVGDGNNVCASFIHAADKFGFDFVFSGPKDLDPDLSLVAIAKSKGTKIEVIRDVSAAVEGADLIVTDTWISMHDSKAVSGLRHKKLAPYRVDDAMLAKAKPDALFMHCLPAHRDEEVTSSVLDGPNSVVFDEAENRLHVQKAIMRWCLSK
jgi:ornithine carbamoyltransferase